MGLSYNEKSHKFTFICLFLPLEHISCMVQCLIRLGWPGRPNRHAKLLKCECSVTLGAKFGALFIPIWA